VLFNPIVPFHFKQGTWFGLDFACVALIGFLCFLFYERLALPPVWGEWLKRLLRLSFGVIVAAFLVTEGLHVIGAMMAKAKTIARVVDVDEETNEPDYGPIQVRHVGVYEFTVGGKKFHGRSLDYDEVGDNVPVLYNPKNPSENRAEGDELTVMDYIPMLFFGGLFLYLVIRQELSDLRRMRRDGTPSEMTEE
jgi:hypothetical protein